MDEDDVEYLEKIIKNETNENITNLSFQEIDTKKREIIDELELSKKYSQELLKKLSEYRYVDELPELQVGRYMRWINLTKPDNLKLTNGGILCEIKMEDAIILVLKNSMNHFFQINMDENLIFQRLSDQEKIILYAIECINK
jgi:hypothetical protein